MRIILLGSNGQLGWEFERFLKDKVELYSFSHKELDILDFSKLFKIFEDIKPDVVINCAAYTKVDKAEEEQDLAYRINALGAKNVSYAAYKIGAKVVYFSTDYVFDGKKEMAYIEHDSPHPLSVYGKSKLFGEYFTKEFNPNHLVLRISWLYGIHGNNFVKTIIKLSKKEKPLEIVNDQWGTPTYTLDVIKQTWALIYNDCIGLYHSSNVGETTWFDFANKIVFYLGLRARVLPIKTKDYPTLAKRPSYSVLKNYLLDLEGMNIMKQWNKALKNFLDKYKEQLLNE